MLVNWKCWIELQLESAIFFNRHGNSGCFVVSASVLLTQLFICLSKNEKKESFSDILGGLLKSTQPLEKVVSGDETGSSSTA
jgi:hypothetical protein